jgi:hypothetical protein
MTIYGRIGDVSVWISLALTAAILMATRRRPAVVLTTGH